MVGFDQVWWDSVCLVDPGAYKQFLRALETDPEVARKDPRSMGKNACHALSSGVVEVWSVALCTALMARIIGPKSSAFVSRWGINVLMTVSSRWAKSDCFLLGIRTPLHDVGNVICIIAFFYAFVYEKSMGRTAGLYELLPVRCLRRKAGMVRCCLGFLHKERQEYSAKNRLLKRKNVRIIGTGCKIWAYFARTGC